MEHLTKTGKKVGHYNVYAPDMAYYRKANPKDKKRKGDLFNWGKWQHKTDTYIKSSCSDGMPLGPWEKYYLVLRNRGNKGLLIKGKSSTKGQVVKRVIINMGDGKNLSKEALKLLRRGKGS